jgi:phosphoglucosamine mutase
MLSTLFGTDGIRGTPGTPPMDGLTLTRLGAGVVRVLGAAGRDARVFIGRDTRESGEWVIDRLARGMVHVGAEITHGGLLTTPAVAFLTREGGFDAGIVVTASHNPFEDNGVKVFTGAGEKVNDDLEARIGAAVVAESCERFVDPVPRIGTVAAGGAYQVYTSRILAGVDVPSSFKVAIDCANGATSQIAPSVLRQLGFDPIVLHDTPNGRNINLDCGSTCPDHLARIVVERGCRLGVAFDGDGDRVVFVDHRGAVINGDAVLLIVARRLAALGRLPGRAVVATVMSNLGLEHALGADDIALQRCPVGDRNVWAKMMRRGIALGGEQSGHVIFADHLPTGDGLATAMMVIRAVIETGQDLADLAGDFVPLPQVFVNVRVGQRIPIAEMPKLSRLIEAIERDLAGDGRVLVRYSGTEPLLRIMVEGRKQVVISGLAEAIAEGARTEFGEGCF